MEGENVCLATLATEMMLGMWFVVFLTRAVNRFICTSEFFNISEPAVI